MREHVIQGMAYMLAAQLGSVPAGCRHVVASMLDEALALTDLPMALRYRLADLPYTCRACERAGMKMRFEELGELIAHRQQHAESDNATSALHVAAAGHARRAA